ncbi:50S ribosomal protein L25/general stress protein Ctc [Bacteroidota bacterium]
MKKVSMSGSLRENVGKKDAKKHRKMGKIPCVLYGGKEQVHFITDEKSFAKLVFTPDVYITEIDVDGNKYKAMLQDVQYHPVSDKILHADFLELVPGKPLVANIPVKLSGVSPGILKGGVIAKGIRKIKVKGLEEDIPDQIEINIGELEIGDSIKVKDIKEEKVDFLDKENQVIIAVRTSRVVVEEVEEEEEGLEEGVAAEGAPAEGGTPGGEKPADAKEENPEK